MDKDKNLKEAAPLPLPPSGGLRRSRRLRANAPSPPSTADGDGGQSAGERKRPRPQKDEEVPQEEEVGDDGDVSVQVSSKKVKTNLAGGDGGRRSPVRRQPQQLENDKGEAEEVEGTISELGEESSSSSVVSAAAGRSGAGAMSSEAAAAAGEEEEEAHPCLFIENVLDVIFMHLIHQPGPRRNVAQDVQNVRLVCKSWTTSITRLYRQTRPDETAFSRYLARITPPAGCKPLNQFMKTMRSSQMIPVQKYSFSSGTYPPKNLKLFREFLLLCGPEAVVLSMSIMSSEAERIMLNLEDLLPTLEMGKLKTLNFRTEEDLLRLHGFEEHGLVKLLTLLLAAAKNLQEVRLGYGPQNSRTYLRSRHVPAVQQLSRVIAKGLPMTVKKLDLRVTMNETAFNNLSEMDVKLESVDLWVSSALGSRAMYKFLQSQAPTLKDFRLWWKLYDTKRHILELPRLPELVNLLLAEGTVSIVGPSHFAETFPKLHCLKLSTEFALSALLSTAKNPSVSMKALDLSKWDFTCPPHLVKNVAQCFPCLAKLEIDLQEDRKVTLEEVFKYLDRLESLHISFVAFNQTANWVDSLFSGIPEDDCGRIGGLPDFGTVNMDGLQRQPSTVNLKKLKNLVIDEHYGNNRLAFTDVSAHFVFLEMENLREIKMPTTAAQFSPRYLELLRDKLVLHG